MERRAVDVGGSRIGYLRAGSGTPVVLLHGGLADARAWKRQLATFAEHHDVVSWDAPGCGGSDDPPRGTPLEGYADRLAAFVAALGFDRPHLVGLSFGGGLALATAARHPGLPRSVVAASAYAGWGGSLPAEEVRRRVAHAEHASDEPPQAWLPGFLDSLYGSSGPDESAEEIATIASERRPEGARTMLYAFAEADLTGDLSKIEAPTLLLYGEEDVRSPRSVAEAIRAEIPGSRLRMLAGVGHALPFEAPDRFDAEVIAFLSDPHGRGPNGA